MQADGHDRSHYLATYSITAEDCFTARRYATAVLCPFVRTSVWLSVTHRYCIETTGRSELGFGKRASFHISYTVVGKFLQKIRVLISGTLSQTLDLENFATASRS